MISLCRRLPALLFLVVIVSAATLSLVVRAESSSQHADDLIGSFLTGEGEFHIQGWRWHTMSLIREARRLQGLASRIADGGGEANTFILQTAADYTVNFNLRGLHRIEKDLFFPWVRQKTAALNDVAVGSAFEKVLDRLEGERQHIEQLGVILMEQADAAARSIAPSAAQLDAVNQVAEYAGSIADAASSMLELEEAMVVPVVAQLVSEPEQKVFNKKVIRKLGVLDSRLHLVGMHEAVWELNDESERELFKNTIPSIPQRLIPRWKRNIYNSRAGVMDT